MDDLYVIYIIFSLIVLIMFTKLCINIGILTRASEKQAYLLKKILERNGGELSPEEFKKLNIRL